MGYEVMLVNWEFDGAVVDDVKAFKDEVKEKCQFGFGEYNVEFDIEEDGFINDMRVSEYFTKWYDEEEFVRILAKHLVEGRAIFEFRDDMEAAEWTDIVVPGADLLFGNIPWEDVGAEVFLHQLEKVKDEKEKQRLCDEYLYHQYVQKTKYTLNIDTVEEKCDIAKGSE